MSANSIAGTPMPSTSCKSTSTRSSDHAHRTPVPDGGRVGALSSGSAFAQSETDRLRDALRSATMQTRALEDQRTALQAKVADADRDKAAAKAEVDALKAQLKKADKEHREAVDEFNQRLAERDETLEKWKSAYEEAATVARSKDAERAKFEGEATRLQGLHQELRRQEHPAGQGRQGDGAALQGPDHRRDRGLARADA